MSRNWFCLKQRKFGRSKRGQCTKNIAALSNRVTRVSSTFSGIRNSEKCSLWCRFLLGSFFFDDANERALTINGECYAQKYWRFFMASKWRNWQKCDTLRLDLLQMTTNSGVLVCCGEIKLKKIFLLSYQRFMKKHTFPHK